MTAHRGLPGKYYCRGEESGLQRYTNVGRKFTLVELMVVLLIVTVVLTLAAPRIGKIPSQIAVQDAKTKIRKAFHFAAMRARATGEPVTLKLDREKSRIKLSEEKSSDSFSPAGSVTAQKENSKHVGQETNQPPPWPQEFPVPERVKWSESGASTGSSTNKTTYIFYPNGSATSPHPLTFSVSGKNFRLTVDRITGKIRIRASRRERKELI